MKKEKIGMMTFETNSKITLNNSIRSIPKQQIVEKAFCEQATTQQYQKQNSCWNPLPRFTLFCNHVDAL